MLEVPDNNPIFLPHLCEYMYTVCSFPFLIGCGHIRSCSWRFYTLSAVPLVTPPAPPSPSAPTCPPSTRTSRKSRGPTPPSGLGPGATRSAAGSRWEVVFSMVSYLAQKNNPLPLLRRKRNVWKGKEETKYGKNHKARQKRRN